MSTDIERLLFYEREYLRSDDFAAEQNYHMEMRRRLNLALHLYGIVNGLELLKGPLTPGVPDQFYISPGMAIDAYGREIVLFAPYAFSEDDLLGNRISQPGVYTVWIAYTREPARPPSPGYRVCDLDNQFTRWREAAEILIANDLKDVGQDPATAPGVAAALSDDADKFPSPIRLGSIAVSLDAANRPVFDHISTAPGDRVYIGLRAQRVKAAVSANPPDAALPITVEADLHETKNLLVGEPFSIDASKVTPAPADPATFPGPSGNVKVHNLFLQGDLYKSVGADWLGLKDYIQQLLPEIQFKTTTLPTAATAADPSTGTDTITVTSTIIKKPSKASVFVALSGIKWVSTSDLIPWLTHVAAASPVQLVASAGTPVKKAGTDNQFDVDLSWSIGPKSAAGPGNVPPEMINVESLTLSYIVVFYP
jgi:hypothetical protein